VAGCADKHKTVPDRRVKRQMAGFTVTYRVPARLMLPMVIAAAEGEMLLRPTICADSLVRVMSAPMAKVSIWAAAGLPDHRRG
jgi:hypothetical protein